MTQDEAFSSVDFSNIASDLAKLLFFGDEEDVSSVSCVSWEEGDSNFSVLRKFIPIKWKFVEKVFTFML